MYRNFGPYIHEPFRYFESVRDEVSYPIYSLLDDFRNTDVFPTCFDRDPHWLPAGARVAAEAIYSYSLNADWFGESSLVQRGAGDRPAETTGSS